MSTDMGKEGELKPPVVEKIGKTASPIRPSREPLVRCGGKFFGNFPEIFYDS